jgi:hypothetical protein
MNNYRDKRITPVWLTSTWENKKQVTASCVEAAVNNLREADQQVTLATIKERVSLLFGRSLSTNTIKRNEQAYQVYLANRRAPKMRQSKSQLVHDFYEDVDPERRTALQARVARLRRQTKDDLIVRLMQAEDALIKQQGIANRLREEILRAHVGVH